MSPIIPALIFIGLAGAVIYLVAKSGMNDHSRGCE
jgi:hypothetical protein